MKGPTSEMREVADQTAARIMKRSPSDLLKQSKEVGLDGDIRAKYKIEVTFGPSRTVQGPNLIGIQVWESGRRLNGGGDDLAFFCLSTESNEGCGGIILSDHIKGGFAFCQSCKRVVNAELITNMKIGKISAKNLAGTLESMFRYLGSNSDIYLKYHKLDIRYAAMEQSKGTETARRLKGMHIYPLKNILRDTAHGASLAGRFLAFVTS